MKNKLSNVSDMLIEQMERLNDAELCHDAESTHNEAMKAAAMVNITNAVINIGLTQLKAYQTMKQTEIAPEEMPQLLLG